jgi:alkylhydroperoxidase family enzyme
MAARVPYLDREDLAETDREIFDNLVAERHRPVGNIFRTLAHTPKLLRRFLALGGELRNGTKLDPKLRELALMTVGRLTEAEYEFTHHWNLARRVGVPREQLEALADFESSPLFSPAERAVMRYAAEATSNVRVSDAAWSAAMEALGMAQMMELVLNVAFYNRVVRLVVRCGV